MDYEKKYKEALKRAKFIHSLLKDSEDSKNYSYVESMEDIFPELAELEDESIRKKIIKLVKEHSVNHERCQMENWLEEQGEHTNFRNKIQIGDKVTRNEDGILVNLSQLKRVAKKEKSIDKDFEAALAKEWKGYVDRGAATVDALEDNTQELAFAKGFYRGWNYPKSSVWHDASKEQPKQGSSVLIVKGHSYEVLDNILKVYQDEGRKWAYINDILEL